ncbi:MAG: AI-2E family transporter [Geobacteraceae bacterium GWC2_58_44]|nr:MAG: AI-2E family transporter [Geobacteraceae bacterium GWC2_58_44]HBG06480.1 AI-2E family transporter [Geobacter sp.]
MDKKVYLSVLAALATAAAIGLFAVLAAPIAKPIAWALIIGIATIPHHARLHRRHPDRPGRSAGLMVLAITICFILPTAGLVITAATNAGEWYKQVEQLIATISRTGASTLSQIPLINTIISMMETYGIDLAGMSAKVASGGSTYILNAAGNVAKNLFDFLFTLAVALFVLFFIYRDGERVVDTFIERLAPNRQKAKRYASEIRSITTAVVVGTILTCCIQGVIAGLGYWVAGVPAPIFCGALTAIAALIPVVGTAIVWVPLVALIALNGAYLTAILLALWCLIFVGMSDNAIRPLAIGATSDIPVLAVVLGAICGVVMMGLLGLILGPLVFGILMSLWDDAVAEIEPVDDAANKPQHH